MLKPSRNVTPAEALQEELDARGWTTYDLAEYTLAPLKLFDGILAGDVVDPWRAYLLAKCFHTSPDLWLNLQKASEEQ